MRNFFCFRGWSIKPLLIVPVLLAAAACCNGQQKAIDSTLGILRSHLKEDSVRVNALIHLSYLYQTSNLRNSEYYATEALDIVLNKLGNDSLASAALYQLGSVFTWEHKTTDALRTYFRLQETAQKVNSVYWQQKACLGAAYVYQLENDWDKAVRYSLQALYLAEKTDNPYDEADVYNHLGAVYMGIGNYSLAQEYLRKAITLFKKDHNPDQLGDAQISLATVFGKLGNQDSARYYFDAAADIYIDLDEPYQLADVYQHMGDMYAEAGKYKTAEEIYKKTIRIYDKDDVSGADYALAVIGLGKVALWEKRYDTASSIFHREFEKVKSAHLVESQLECLRYMTRVDSAMGNYREALQHMQAFATLYDNYYSDAKTRTTQRMLLEFDVEQKEKENQQLKLQNRLQHQDMEIIAVAGILVLVAGGFLALLYKQKTAALRSVREMQAATAKQNKELEVINAVKDKLISMIAHDVRSPLTSLHNTLHLTREKILDHDEFENLSSMLDNDIRHLIGMLDNTLMWAREQIHSISVHKTSFSLRIVAEDVISLYHQAIDDKDITVYNNIPPDTDVISDKEIIHITLRNLLSNAIKFTPPGSSIELNAESMDGTIYVTVKDEGAGISKDILEKINNKEFVSTRGTKNEKGTGLGLMFSKDLLSKLGEKFFIETFEGKGTSVIFSISHADRNAA